MHELFGQRRYLIPFRSGLLPQIFCDVLVVGAGVAGLRAAIEAAEAGAEVIVLSKGGLDQTNTAWAQGGIAAAMRSDDSAAFHVEDTLTAGAGLCDRDAVELVCREGPGRLDEVIGWGMALDTGADGRLMVGREGGHSASRIYHAGGDRTGVELQRTLTARARQSPRIRIFEKCFALDLITPTREAGAPVLGAITHHARYGLQMLWARSTVLASGGAGQVFRESTNPREATADGLAMAYRAGATLADMCFVQFHPTALYLPGAQRALISEAVRGEGALLLDDDGRRFMPDEHELAELAPRDVVSRAIVRRIAAQGGGRGWLDCRRIERFAERFPSIAQTLRRFDLNAAEQLIPVHPAAHYMIGGVRTDLVGRTGVPNLYAVGEASCSGLNGANRLASNSLLEGLVFGAIAGAAAAGGNGSGPHPPGGNGPRPVPVVSDIRPSEQGELDLGDVRSSLRSAMWRNVGVERTGPRLGDAAEMLAFWARYTLDKIFDGPEGWEVQNMLTVGAMIAESALARDESRGTHTRTDAPGLAAEPVHDLQRIGTARWTEPARGGASAATVEASGLARTV
jgi:L-aspartate oxidase